MKVVLVAHDEYSKAFLQKKGIYKETYENETLRAHLELKDVNFTDSQGKSSPVFS